MRHDFLQAVDLPKVTKYRQCGSFSVNRPLMYRLRNYRIERPSSRNSTCRNSCLECESLLEAWARARRMSANCRTRLLGCSVIEMRSFRTSFRVI